MAFHKATKYASFLRLAMFGISGSGKTFTALRIAKGMGLKTALIDTEYGSASKYGDRFDFETDRMDEDQSVAALILKMEEAKQGGYELLIVDSGSHSWRDLLSEIDELAKAKYHGNTHAAWSEGTPKQKALISALLSYPGHVIFTFRSKTEWVIEANDRGQSAPRRVGLAPEAGKGIEYEFDILMEMNLEHTGYITKDRTGKFQDKIIKKPDEKFGVALLAWLRDAPPAPPKPEALLRAKLVELLKVVQPLLNTRQLEWVTGVVERGAEKDLKLAIDKLEMLKPAAATPPAGNGNGKAPAANEAWKKSLADLNEVAAHALVTDTEREKIQGEVAVCTSDMMLAVLASRWANTLAERQGWTGGTAPAGDPPPENGEGEMSEEERQRLSAELSAEERAGAEKEAEEPEYDSTAVAEMAAEELGAAVATASGRAVVAGENGEIDLF